MNDYGPGDRRPLNVSHVWCADGQYRTFRRVSFFTDNGFIRKEGVSISGWIAPIPGDSGGWYFTANPRGKNYHMLVTNPLEQVKTFLNDFCTLANVMGYSADEQQIGELIGLYPKPEQVAEQADIDRQMLEMLEATRQTSPTTEILPT